MELTAIILTRGDRSLPKLKSELEFCDDILVIRNTQISDFAKVRNDALKKAKGDWVLFVDDDEEVNSNLKKEILFSIRRPDYNGFYLRRLNLFFGKPSGRDMVLRLAKKNSGKWQREIHEVWKVKGRIGTLSNYLIHHSRSNLRDEIEKINFYSSLHAKANFKEGKQSNLLKIMFYPFFKLDQNLIEGKGFTFALLHSFHSFLAWSKLYIWQRNLH